MSLKRLLGEREMNGSKIAFEIAFAQLRGQKEDLRNVRNQASFAAAITGLIATVFASMVPAERVSNLEVGQLILGISLDALLVFILFSASMYFAIMVMTNVRTCIFEFDPRLALDGGGEDELLAQYAKFADRFFDGNEEVIGEARSNLWRALVCGWAQIPAWLNLIF